MTLHLLHKDVPALEDSGWDSNENSSIQAWLVRAPGRLLKNTEYGIRDEAMPADAVFEDPLVNQVIKMDIASFLVAEHHSVKNTAAMIALAPDERSRGFLASQVLDEARHFEVFARRLADLGVAPPERAKLMQQYCVPAMQRLFDLIDEQVDKGSFVGAVIGQNLILEGMAFPVYRYESKYWSYFDPGLSQIIRGAFADEVHHTGYGESYLRNCLSRDPGLRNEVTKLIGDFYVIMKEMFGVLIRHYVGLYQAAADEHMDQLGAIEIFPGRTMATTSEEDQMRILSEQIEAEYRQRSAAVGIHLS